MSDRLVTVATFGNPVEANLARNRLETAGVRAFLADEETVSMAWHLTNALGGIKLQVGNHDAEEALTVLTGSDAPDLSVPGPTEAALPQPSAVEEPPGFGEVASDEPERELTSRGENADRALRGAVLGLLLLPLQLYVFWLLLKVFVSDEQLDPDKRRRALVAALVNLPLMFGFCLWLRTMFSA